MNIIEQAKHKNCVRDLTSCKGVLESTQSLTPTGGEGQTSPGENPERPIPNCRKATDDPKHRDMTDISMGKKQASSGQEIAHKWPLANFSNLW